MDRATHLSEEVVGAACLACHGEKNTRPEFVKEKFPEDRAHGFNAGDLRGLYSVFVADSTLTDRPEYQQGANLPSQRDVADFGRSSKQAKVERFAATALFRSFVRNYGYLRPVFANSREP